MSSGYSIDQEVLHEYQRIKNGRTPKEPQAKSIPRANRPRFFVMNLDNSNNTVVLGDIIPRTGDCKEDLETLHSYLPDKEARFVCIDMDFDLGNGEKREKMVFIQWVPDNCTIREKMLFAATADIVKKKMDGLSAAMHGADKSDVQYDDIWEKCKKN